MNTERRGLIKIDDCLHIVNQYADIPGQATGGNALAGDRVDDFIFIASPVDVRHDFQLDVVRKPGTHEVDRYPVFFLEALHTPFSMLAVLATIRGCPR